MKNILIATDFSAHADRALEKAILLSKEFSATLHLLHVTQPISTLQELVEDRKSLSHDTQELLQSYLKGYPLEEVNMKSHIVTGDAFAEIIKLSQKVDADLIIMGMHNKAELPDLFTGTTVERVIRKGNKPTLVVKDKPVAYKNIAVAIDFSDASYNALNVATTFAPSATFNLIHIYDTSFAGSSYNKDVDTFIHEESNRRLDELINKQDTSLTFQKITDRNAVVEGIISATHNVKANLLVIGNNSRSGIGNFILGSATTKILTNPPCDVLVVGNNS